MKKKLNDLLYDFLYFLLHTNKGAMFIIALIGFLGNAIFKHINFPIDVVIAWNIVIVLGILERLSRDKKNHL